MTWGNGLANPNLVKMNYRRFVVEYLFVANLKIQRKDLTKKMNEEIDPQMTGPERRIFLEQFISVRSFRNLSFFWPCLKELLKNRIEFKYCHTFCRTILQFYLETLDIMDDTRLKHLHQYFQEAFSEIYMPEMKIMSSDQSRKRKWKNTERYVFTLFIKTSS